MSYDDAGANDAAATARPRLTAADEAAVDAVLGAGFNPDALSTDERQRRVRALLAQLDALPDADGPRLGDPSLVDATLAHIERTERQREAVGTEPVATLPPDVLGSPWRRALLGVAAAILMVFGTIVALKAGAPVATPTGGTAPTLAAGITKLPWSIDEVESAKQAVVPERDLEAAPSDMVVGSLVAIPVAIPIGRTGQDGRAEVALDWDVYFVPRGTPMPSAFVQPGVRVVGPVVMRPARLVPPLRDQPEADREG